MCADPIDDAAELTQQLIDIAVQNRPRPTMTFTGACHYCEEKVDKGFFCCHECKDDYERIERAAKHRRAA